jgi:ABC-type Fe3+ transport system permease subunit
MKVSQKRVERKGKETQEDARKIVPLMFFGFLVFCVSTFCFCYFLFAFFLGTFKEEERMRRRKAIKALQESTATAFRRTCA